MRSVNLGRWSRRVERYFNMKGGGGLMDVDQSVRVVLPIQSGVEDRYLEGWTVYAGTTTVAAAAGFQSGYRLRNPPGSNVLVVVEKLQLTTTVNDTFSGSFGATTTDLVTGGTNTLALDRRSNLNATSLFSTQNTTATVPALNAPVGGFFLAGILAGTTIDAINGADQQIPILPGFAIQVVLSNVNETMFVTHRIRERAMEQSELT